MGQGIIVHGYACIDNSVAMPIGGFKPGEIVTTEPISTGVGGVCGNTGTALIKLGREVYLAGRVGQDMNGAAMKRYFELMGARTYFIEDSKHPTSVSLILVPPGGDRVIIHNQNANVAIHPDDLTPELLQQAGHYHFGYFGLSAGVDIPALLKKARDEGLTTSFDTHGSPTANDKAYFEQCAKYATLLFPSIKEIAAIAGSTDPEELCKYLAGLGPEWVGVKLGENGAAIRHKNGGFILRPAYDIKVVSTLGAGDSFYAGVIDQFTLGGDIGQIITNGSAVAACRCLGMSPDHISMAAVKEIIRHTLRKGETRR